MVTDMNEATFCSPHAYCCECVHILSCSISQTASVLEGQLDLGGCVRSQRSLRWVVFHHGRLIIAAASLLAAWQDPPISLGATRL